MNEFTGGIFFTLLTYFKDTETAKSHTKGNKESYKEGEIFRLFLSLYFLQDIPACSTHSTYSTDYKRCKKNLEKYLELNNTIRVDELRKDITSERKFLPFASNLLKCIPKNNWKPFVNAILFFIEHDDTISPGAEFYITNSTKAIPKKDLIKIDKVEICYFLVGVLEYLLRYKKNNVNGLSTFNSYFSDNPSQVLPITDPTYPNASLINPTDISTSPNISYEIPTPKNINLCDNFYNLFISNEIDLNADICFEISFNRCFNGYSAQKFRHIDISNDFNSVLSFFESLPCIFSNEFDKKSKNHIMVLGYIKDIKVLNKKIVFYGEKIATLPYKLDIHKEDFDIQKLEIYNTHWAVKQVNIIDELTYSMNLNDVFIHETYNIFHIIELKTEADKKIWRATKEFFNKSLELLQDNEVYLRNNKLPIIVPSYIETIYQFTSLDNYNRLFPDENSSYISTKNIASKDLKSVFDNFYKLLALFSELFPDSHYSPSYSDPTYYSFDDAGHSIPNWDEKFDYFMEIVNSLKNIVQYTLDYENIINKGRD